MTGHNILQNHVQLGSREQQGANEIYIDLQTIEPRQAKNVIKHPDRSAMQNSTKA